MIRNLFKLGLIYSKFYLNVYYFHKYFGLVKSDLELRKANSV